MISTFIAQTKVEKAAATLEKRLSKLRASEQDPNFQGNRLVPADPEDLRKIKERWRLPKVYLEFLEKFSPFCVGLYNSKKSFSPVFNLYGAHELIEMQNGYSWSTADNAPIEGWHHNLLVIGDLGADPFCIDLSSGDDPAVHYAEHGMGDWDFGVFRSSFTSFLDYLAKKGFVDLDDDSPDH